MSNIGSQRKMSDIIPPQKNETGFKRVEIKKQIDVKKPEAFFSQLPPKPQKPKKIFFSNFKIGLKNWKIFLVAFVVLAVYGITGFVFAKMKVELTPKLASFDIDEVVEFSRNPKNGELLFSEISLASKKRAEFDSSEKRSVEVKAHGTITVYNKDKDPQVLVANTRFESQSGKIYRIEKQIIIPKSGSLDVDIIADKAGDMFNEEAIVDFTIPGFKEQNSPKFKTIYGKSKTKITGGFSGTSFIVGEADVKNAKTKTLNQVSLETKEDLVRKLPSESFLLAQSIRYSVAEEKIEPRVGSASQKFSFEVSGAASGVIANIKNLEDFLAHKTPFYNSSYRFNIKNMSDISFELVDFKPGVERFKVKVKGTAQFVSELDAESIRAQMFQDRIKKSSALILAFPALESVEISFRPFWLRLFPENLEGIDIKITSR